MERTEYPKAMLKAFVELWEKGHQEENYGYFVRDGILGVAAVVEAGIVDPYQVKKDYFNSPLRTDVISALKDLITRGLITPNNRCPTWNDCVVEVYREIVLPIMGELSSSQGDAAWARFNGAEDSWLFSLTIQQEQRARDLVIEEEENEKPSLGFRVPREERTKGKEGLK